MATFSAPDLNSKAMPMGNYGNAAVVYGTATPLSGVAGSIYRPVRIPAGMSVTALRIVNDDMDTGGTTFAVKIGHTSVEPSPGKVLSRMMIIFPRLQRFYPDQLLPI
jgi:hypothetical protein